MPRREDHEVHKDMWWQWTKKKHFKLPLDLEEQNEMNLPLSTNDLETLVPYSCIIQRDRCHYRVGMEDKTHR